MVNREESEHALVRNFSGSQHYENRGPITPRKSFHCDACEKFIPKGTDVKFVIKAYGDDGDWPSTEVCGLCMEDDKIKAVYNDINNGVYDYD